MNKQLQYLYQRSNVSPSPSLENRVLLAVEQERQKQDFRNRILVSFGLSASVLTLIPAAWVYGGQFFGSDFWSMFTLLFSDIQVVWEYSSDFFLSLLEMFPIEAAALLFIPTFAFLLFLRMYVSLEDQWEKKSVGAHSW